MGEDRGSGADAADTTKDRYRPHAFKSPRHLPSALSSLGGPMPGGGSMPSFVARGDIGTRDELACLVCGRQKDDEIHD